MTQNEILPNVHATQGGGYVTYSESAGCYLFVEPPNWGDYRVGSQMPLDWGLAGPVNDQELREKAKDFQ